MSAEFVKWKDVKKKGIVVADLDTTIPTFGFTIQLGDRPMASIKKAKEQAQQEKNNPKEKPKTKRQLKAEARAAQKENSKCWTQEPSRKYSVKGKEIDLQGYLDIPLHKKWGITIKPASQKQEDKDMALTTHCKEKALGRFCSGCGYPRGLIRQRQLRVNDDNWQKRAKKGEAGHHKQYRNKPNTIAKKLIALGEDPEKRLVQGAPLPKTLAEKVAKTPVPETNPAKAAKKAPAAKKPKADKLDAALQDRQREKRKAASEPESKVKQGPISGQKKDKPKASTRKKKDKPDQSALPLNPAEPPKDLLTNPPSNAQLETGDSSA